MAIFKDRLKEVMQLRGKRLIDLSEETGISKGTISKYLKGDMIAKQDSIFLMSKALNVNPIYLMGMSDDFTPPEYKKIPEIVRKEDEIKQRIIIALNSLSEDQLLQVEAIIKTFTARRQT